MRIKVSVVVCTINRSELLASCLKSLCQQKLDSENFEIIVVDNNSSDDTPQIVESFMKAGNLHYVPEMKSGLSNARNRGLQEAQGKLVAYIDDDAKADPDWLRGAINILKSNQSDIHCLGGPVLPFFTTPKPIWFEDKYEYREHGTYPKYLNKDEALSGSNMIWNKDVLNKIGGFDVNIGMIGNQLRMGEETYAFQNLWSLYPKARIYYSPELVIFHWVPKSKMKISYRLKRRFTMGQYSAYQMESENMSTKVKSVLTLLSKISKTCLRSLTNIKAYPHWQNWIVEDISPLAAYIGKLLGLAGIRPRVSQKS